MDAREKSSNEKLLIDANALMKEANADGAYGYVDAKQITDAPTVDAVEVVRCRDCEHFRDYIDRHGVARMYCIKNNHVPNVEPEHYCSYGERKEGADNG